jgi:hypothetical protein
MMLEYGPTGIKILWVKTVLSCGLTPAHHPLELAHLLVVGSAIARWLSDISSKNAFDW